MYSPLFHKYRPKQLSEVACQNVLTTVINNAILSNCISHAYIFAGMRGVGKTSTARIIASTINCSDKKIIDSKVFSCGKCQNCSLYSSGAHPDIVEIDAASNTGVDHIKTIIEDCAYKSMIGEYKVYIIDEVHMLSKSAFNAFLKTLEEPPKKVIFILATTEPSKVPSTILSRCQRFELQRANISDMTKFLEDICIKDKILYSHQHLTQIAKASEGSLRDSLSILEKTLLVNDKKEKFIDSNLVGKITGAENVYLYLDLIGHILECDINKSFDTIKSIHDIGIEKVVVINHILDIVVNLAKHSMGVKEIIDDSIYESLYGKAKLYSVLTFSIIWQMLTNWIVKIHNIYDDLVAMQIVVMEIICALKMSKTSNDMNLNGSGGAVTVSSGKEEGITSDAAEGSSMIKSYSDDNTVTVSSGKEEGITSDVAEGSSMIKSYSDDNTVSVDSDDTVRVDSDGFTDEEKKNNVTYDSVVNNLDQHNILYKDKNNQVNQENLSANSINKDDISKLSPDLKYFIKILDLLQDFRYFELYYYLMHEIKLVSCSENKLVIVTQNANFDLVKKLNNFLRDKYQSSFDVIVSQEDDITTISPKDKLIQYFTFSKEWQMIREYFPKSKIIDLLYKS